MTHSVKVKRYAVYFALPHYLDTDCNNIFTHIADYTKKIIFDVKKLGFWVTDVQESRCHVWVTDVQESRCHGDIGTPSTGVEELNIKKELWHHWNPFHARMHDGTTAVWPELLSSDHVWDKNSWVWNKPTWYTAGATRRALLVSKQDCDKSSSTKGEYEY